MTTDKLNRVDFHWYVLRTKRHQEGKLTALLQKEQAKTPNILEVYAPTHTTVRVSSDSDERQRPLFSGIVFVLATESALMSSVRALSLEADIQYERRKEEGERTGFQVIPEEQMQAFRDYNENYADQVIVLERPYTDYAFNDKEGEPNEIVRVIDGPLAGREGYICRFRRERRLVFQVRGFEPGSYLTVSFPNAWRLHVVRLHNAEGDRLSVGTEKARAVDLLVGFLQGCGYGERTLPMLHSLIGQLVAQPSLTDLCRSLRKQGEAALALRLEQMTGQEAQLLINLVRYERDYPGYIETHWGKLVLRPFLTPTSGVEMAADQTEAELPHQHFTELIRRVPITEQVYYPSEHQSTEVTTTYYAHIGIMPSPTASDYTLFANWNDFLGEYFLTAGKANEKLVSGTTQTVRSDTARADKEKLIASFRNYAPILYKVLTDASSPVKALRGLRVGSEQLHALVIQAKPEDLQAAKDTLIDTCVGICQSLNTTHHLSVWRRYLRTVWLHQ